MDAMAENLTAKELEMLKLLAEGQTLESVASMFHMKPQTVRSYALVIREKLDCRTTVSAVAVAIRKGLI